jgi:hypothetical protein
MLQTDRFLFLEVKDKNMEVALCVMVVIDVADAFDGLINSENGFNSKVNKIPIDLSTKYQH